MSRQRGVREGDWLSISGKVVGLHGRDHLVLRIEGAEVTVLRSVVWTEDKNVDVLRRPRKP
jgi:hypothetical protein